MRDEHVKIGSNEPQKYPKSIAFIISNEFCERFNYYGMRTILVLYLTIKLGYSDDAATVLFHIFSSLVYFFPIFGAIIADSFLGKFKTIFYLSCVYAVGSVMIAVGAIPILRLPVQACTVFGLLLIGLGSGGIKPCVSAFGGDQFKIPEQAKQLATFFSFFYFSINAGSLISTYLMPILREDVHCFSEEHCFSLAFGVPGILMVMSIIVFVAGKKLYVVKKPTGNVIVDVVKCVYNAIAERSKQTQGRLPHWLDYAEPAYSPQLISDIKSVLKILLLFVPLPLFWALFDQQGSRWTFQATRMDGDIGFTDIKPDQMQVLNPLLILVFIPLFDCAVYPALSLIGIRRPLQKLTLGGIFAGIAFVISAFVEIQLEKTYPVFPEPTESQVRIFNGMPCNYSISSFDESQSMLGYLGLIQLNINTDVDVQKEFIFSPSGPSCRKITKNLKLQPGVSNSFFISGDMNSPRLQSFIDNVKKSKNGYPTARVLSTLNSISFIKLVSTKTGEVKKIDSSSIDQFEIVAGWYTVYADDHKVGDVELAIGGVFTLVISQNPNDVFQMQLHVVTRPNKIHMLWLIPQIMIITAGEVMFSVTGLEFAYSQAPASMKSLLQACWLLTVAFGNIIVVVIAEAKIFHSQASEFLLFAVLMFIDMSIFAFLATKYKYVTNSDKIPTDLENKVPIENTRKTFTNDAFEYD